jgi:hypothetical protein
VSEKILVALFQSGQNNYVNQWHQTGGRVNRAVDQLLQAKKKDFAESMSERQQKAKIEGGAVDLYCWRKRF